jgi:predicted TIM-barrel fold metal-dependent hydrolase
MAVVDVQHHYVPHRLATAAGWRPGERYDVMNGSQRVVTLHDRVVDLEWHVRDMDAGAVDVAVLSSFLGWDAPVEQCAIINDDLAKLTATSERFRGYAHVPTTDPEAGTRELDRACDDLGLAGLTVTSRVDGRHLDDPSLDWLWTHVEAKGIAVFVHPVLYAGGHVGAEDYELERIVAREFDLVTAVTRVIASGLLDRHPGLMLVFAHFGGGISALKDRIRNKSFRFGTGLERTFEDYFGDLYFDTAGFELAETALTCALTGISPHRLCFATDYPQDFTGVQTATGVGADGMAAYAQRIRSLDLPAGDIEAILGGNAARILRL